MPLKNGEMVVQELDSSRYKNRDDEDMARQGKKQQFQRNFGFLSMLGFTTTMMCTWEAVLLAPTSSGQYHWVAMLAPKGKAKFLSWVAGWLDLIGWWANTAAELLVCVLVNSIGAKFLPKVEGMILILHIMGFFAVLIPLVYLAPHKNADAGLTWLIGLMGTNMPFIGYDGPCHMAEEVVNASIIVPWCMISTILLNGTLGFAIVLAFLLCIGNVEDAMDSSTGYGFIEVFFKATGSHAGTSVMTAIPTALVMCASFGFLTSASRLTWAFARDKGIPFSNFLSHVNTGSNLPVRAVGLCAFITALICVINVGSSAAFNAIISLTTAGLFASYEISIILMLIKKIKGESIPYGPWTLGRFGIVINIASISFLTIAIFFSFFPEELPVTAENMNWSVVVFSGELIIGLVWYAVRGRKVYNGPIIDPGVMPHGGVHESFQQ
ncbi:Amino acid/polyamine transporter I [Penicillium malachiteum]|nr:Amino acid/polyamine transporter I [Penicillium malachiteum]